MFNAHLTDAVSKGVTVGRVWALCVALAIAPKKSSVPHLTAKDLAANPWFCAVTVGGAYAIGDQRG